MSDTIELRVFHLLCAKLCHDLVSPVGAVSNGVELLQDMGPDDAGEILGLIVDSSGKASDRLKFYRVAYGLAADSVRSDAEAKELASGMMAGHGITLDWQLDPVMVTPLSQNAVKLLLNMLLLAAETLARGGTISVRLTDDAESQRLDVEATGQDADLSEEAKAGLKGDADVAEMTPRNVQGYFTACYARSFGGSLAFSESENRVTLSSTISL